MRRVWKRYSRNSVNGVPWNPSTVVRYEKPKTAARERNIAAKPYRTIGGKCGICVALSPAGLVVWIEDLDLIAVNNRLITTYADSGRVPPLMITERNYRYRTSYS
jgi:hypothetical protein